MKSLVDKVATRSMVPFFGLGKEAWQFEPNEWNALFYAPQVFLGREKYYWFVL
jgi:hypothetical protein